MHVLSSLVIAFATYSRIPMPRVEWTDENRKYSMCFFPAIGIVIGLLMALWLWLCDILHVGALLQGAVGMFIPLLVTGGIHMDGFMDTCDALASWQPKEKRLEILKDSHVGAFAVIGCGAYMVLMTAVLSEATVKDAVLLSCCYVISRTLSAWTLTYFKGARPNGMLDQFARTAKKKMVSRTSIVYLLACLIAGFLGSGYAVLLCAAAAALCVAVYRHMSYKQFGGVTGDLAGWFLQITEMCCIAATVLGGKIG